MKLLIDILQGLGLSGAAGIRPFLPAFVVGAVGRANLFADFERTDFAFVESNAWLIATAVLMVIAVLLRNELTRPGLSEAVQGLGLGLGGLLTAAMLAGDHYAWWPGIPAGIAAAWVTGTASRGIFARAGARLDAEARAQLPLYAEGVAMLLSVLSVVAPPVGPLAIGLAIWLLLRGGRRDGEKYAGLRILR